MTGLRARTVAPVRNVMDAPGHLVRVDVKRLGGISAGGGHRARGRKIGNQKKQKQTAGNAFLHHAVDDCSRLVYLELLADEPKDKVAGFWFRANGFFTVDGVVLKTVTTDNGPCYKSRVFADGLGDQVADKRPRPYRPPRRRKNRTVQPHADGRMGLRLRLFLRPDPCEDNDEFHRKKFSIAIGTNLPQSQPTISSVEKINSNYLSDTKGLGRGVSVRVGLVRKPHQEREP